MRKTFVAPKLVEEASLAKLTLSTNPPTALSNR